MDLNFDANIVFNNRLAESLGLIKYRDIIETVGSINVSENADFQKTFNGFYVVRRNEEWRKVYYDLFEQVKTGAPTFASILTHLYEHTGNIEASFSSKMLASIFPDKPIWDQYVLQKLSLKLVGSTKQERLKNAIVLYSDIEKWYDDFLKIDKAKECIEVFDRVLPDYKDISSIKKIDCILWSIR